MYAGTATIDEKCWPFALLISSSNRARSTGRGISKPCCPVFASRN